jgi:hypothetical protein
MTTGGADEAMGGDVVWVVWHDGREAFMLPREFEDADRAELGGAKHEVLRRPRGLEAE